MFETVPFESGIFTMVNAYSYDKAELFFLETKVMDRHQIDESIEG